MNTWEIIDGKLTKEFKFKNFVEAVRFINAITEIAERHDHHPDIYLHSYKLVKITLITYSANAITDKDYHLAKEIDALV